MMSSSGRNETLITQNNARPNNLTTGALQATLTILIMAAVVIGNILVLLVIYRQRTRPRVRVANMFISNLAVVDLLIGLLLFPFAVATVLLQGWIYGDALCQFNGAVNVIAGAASILTMAAISIDRYRAIVSQPGRKLRPKEAWALLTTVWTVSIVMGVLPVLGWNKYVHSSLSTMCKMSFTQDQGYILLVAVACFLIPLLIMFYCYLRVFLKVRFHKKQMQRWNNGRDVERNFQRETKTARIVFTVLFVFAACWTPFVIVHILQAVTSLEMSRILFSSVTLIAGMHSACNPVIYTTMNKTFRNEMLQICPCVRRGFVFCFGRQDLVQPFDAETSLT